jgi:hypothetical protein
MQDARKSNIPSFSRGTSSKPIEEKKKKIENQEFPNDGIKELTQLIKQMEVNHANQMNSMQNRLIAMERSQSSRSHHKPNDKWPKRPPLKIKGHQTLLSPPTWLIIKPYLIVDLVVNFDEEMTCPVFLEGYDEEDYSKNEQVNMCGRKYNVGMHDWMDFAEQGSNVNCMNNVVDKATKNMVLSLLHNKFQKWPSIEALLTIGMDKEIKIDLKQTFLR